MNGEWPILRNVTGEQGKSGRHLSTTAVRDQFVEQQLPELMPRHPRLAA